MYDSFPFGVFLGGIGLFLLGMMVMSDGLKSASGPALTRILEKSTDTKIKGFLSGFLATAVMQSSTATTLLAIGFVNAGILTFVNSLWLIFGANVGMTMTGWLVALIGMKFDVELFALPMIGIGVAIRMLGSKKKWGSIGDILSGFGMLFLGLGFIQDAFAHADKMIDFMAYSGNGIVSLIAFLLAGFVLTVIMQSSSASIAIIMTLATTAGLPMLEAACAVIGANIGTTMTALFVSIGATANAKRTAGAHILFNVVTGVSAVIILPILLQTIGLARGSLGLDDNPATDLALFHTTFNIFGVLLMIPLSGYIARFLGSMFTREEVPPEAPKYIDDTLFEAPQLAISALEKELDRYREILVSSLRGFISYLNGEGSVLPKVNKLDDLGEEMTRFIVKLNQSAMSADTSDALTDCLKLRDQYSRSAMYLKRLVSEYKTPVEQSASVVAPITAFLDEVDSLLKYIDVPADGQQKSISNRKLDALTDSYDTLRASLMQMTVKKQIDVREMESLVGMIRSIRKMVKYFAKAQRVASHKHA